jgi:hypothetical protein
MTKAVFTVKNGRIVQVASKGHTGYAAEGEDIVCAAISAVLQGAALGVMQIARAKVQYSVDDKKGALRLALEDGQDEKVTHDAEIILRTALIAAQDIAASYSQYVSVEVKSDEVY